MQDALFNNTTESNIYAVKPVQSDTPRDQVNVSDCTGCRNRYSYHTYA